MSLNVEIFKTIEDFDPDHVAVKAAIKQINRRSSAMPSAGVKNLPVEKASIIRVMPENNDAYSKADNKV